MSAGLRVDRIQGNVHPGFNKDGQAFLWLRFPSSDAARAWLRETVSDITSAGEVIAFRARRERRLRPEVGQLRSTWVNVAFSKAGLDLLRPSPAGTFPEAFERGMARRAGLTGDSPDTWRFGGTPDTEAHALVVIGTDTESDLQAALTAQRERLARHGARDLFLEALGEDCRGAKLSGALRGHEHFGYRDGISQPALDGAAGAGDFVLGYADATGQASGCLPGWTRDGSYVVFRRLRQDVAGFHQALETLLKSSGLKNRAQLGAKLVGRWPSGAKLGDPIEESDPGVVAAPTEYASDEYAADPTGARVPRFAHVRKAHPRDANGGGAHHRLLRRGIPYGPPLAATESGGPPPDDGRDRGLIFLAYQADLGHGFELVQRWLNDRNLPAPRTGPDPIAGQVDDPTRLVLRSSTALPTAFDMHHFVSMTGGGYFFMPSISAVRFLADPTTTWEQQEANMGDLMQQQLGELITSENPYGLMSKVLFDSVTRTGLAKARSSGKPFPDDESRVRTPDQPQYWQGFFWTVEAQNGGTETVRVSKVLRIPYTVNGHQYELVVGFQGAGGP
jgi:Dyp-type peroxidase family